MATEILRNGYDRGHFADWNSALLERWVVDVCKKNATTWAERFFGLDVDMLNELKSYLVYCLLNKFFTSSSGII